MLRLRPFTAVLALAVILGAQSAHGAQRAFVASFGSDANTASGCGLANPCRGFTAAMTVVDAGGEILALDAAGYGVVTIDKSVSLIANTGSYAVTESVASHNGTGFQARSHYAGSPAGFGSAGARGGNARLTVTHSAASNNTRGMFLPGDLDRADIRGVAGYNTFTENDVGMGWSVAPPTGFGVTLFSTGNNVVKLNTTDTSGAITATSLK
jgi:hypothetical protein